MKTLRLGLILLASGVAALAQSYTISTIAGGAPPATPAAASTTPIGTARRIAGDSAGNVYFTSGNSVFKIDTSGILTVVAGNSRPGFSGDGGQATAAQLSSPEGLVFDSTGNLYIADSGNNRIRMVSTEGIITTVVGTGVKGYDGDYEAATKALLRLPTAVTFDSSGNLFIADTGNHCIRKVSSDGIIWTVAGTGHGGFIGDNGLAIDATLDGPQDVVVDGLGDIYIADTNNNLVRKVDHSTGKIGIFAGSITTNVDHTYNYTYAVTDSDYRTEDQTDDYANVVNLSAPTGLAFNAAGDLLIVEHGNNMVRWVPKNLIITTLAGSEQAGFAGDGQALSSTQLSGPLSICIDANGYINITDPGNYRIRRIANKVMSTLAGNGEHDFAGDGGQATAALLNQPYGTAVDSSGNLYFSDLANHRVRKIATDGTITTVAGNGTYGSSGDGGQATAAKLAAPTGVAVDSAGNLYIADSDSSVVRKVTSEGVISTVAGTGSYGSSGDGSAATSATLRTPFALAVDSSDNLYIADPLANKVRKVSTSGTITTVAGSGYLGFTGDGGTATSARLRTPFAVAVDGSGNIYIADTGNNRIRRVNSYGVIKTVVGNGYAGSTGDGGLGTSAQVAAPSSLAVDSAGNLFISGIGSSRVRMLSDGYVTTVAGGSTLGYSGDGGDATSAEVDGVAGLAVDASGNVYLTDNGNNAVRKLTPVSTTGVVL